MTPHRQRPQQPSPLRLLGTAAPSGAPGTPGAPRNPRSALSPHTGIPWTHPGTRRSSGTLPAHPAHPHRDLPPPPAAPGQPELPWDPAPGSPGAPGPPRAIRAGVPRVGAALTAGPPAEPPARRTVTSAIPALPAPGSAAAAPPGRERERERERARPRARPGTARLPRARKQRGPEPQTALAQSGTCSGLRSPLGDQPGPTSLWTRQDSHSSTRDTLSSSENGFLGAWDPPPGSPKRVEPPTVPSIWDSPGFIRWERPECPRQVTHSQKKPLRPHGSPAKPPHPGQGSFPG